MMKAMVFRGVGEKPQLGLVPRPTIQHPTDVVIRVHKTTICGTDLHILGGNVPTCPPGRVLGHEGIGHVVEVGSAVQRWKIGDRILTRCITACGTCAHCQQDLHAFCVDGGWQLGNTLNGMQAEYCLIPHADHTCHKLPDTVPPESSSREDAYVMCSDILPTGYEIGLLAGRVPAEASIAIVGVGPVGMATLLSIQAMDKERGASDHIKDQENNGSSNGGHVISTRRRRVFAIDRNSKRLEHAARLGATDLINNQKGDAIQQVMDLTENQGVDFCVECIGLPVGWDICQDIVKMGGSISILGVHGRPGVIKLEKLWQHNISIHTGMVHCSTTQYFMDSIQTNRIDANLLISHQFGMSDLEEAYEHFANAEQTGSLKVLITNDMASS